MSSTWGEELRGEGKSVASLYSILYPPVSMSPLNSDTGIGSQVTLTSVLVIGVTRRLDTVVLGAAGSVVVALDSSDQPLGPMSLVDWILNLYSVKGLRLYTV